MSANKLRKSLNVTWSGGYKGNEFYHYHCEIELVAPLLYVHITEDLRIIEKEKNKLSMKKKK